MRKLAVLTAVLLGSLAALAGSADLVGTWKVDTLKMMQMLGQAPPPGVDPAEMAKRFSMTIEMAKDGSWTFVTRNPDGEQTQRGRWREVSRDGATVIVETSDDEGQTQEFHLTFESDDTVVAAMPNGPKMFLERVK